MHKQKKIYVYTYLLDWLYVQCTVSVWVRWWHESNERFFKNITEKLTSFFNKIYGEVDRDMVGGWDGRSKAESRLIFVWDGDMERRRITYCCYVYSFCFQGGGEEENASVKIESLASSRPSSSFYFSEMMLRTIYRFGPFAISYLILHQQNILFFFLVDNIIPKDEWAQHYGKNMCKRRSTRNNKNLEMILYLFSFKK